MENFVVRVQKYKNNNNNKFTALPPSSKLHTFSTQNIQQINQHLLPEIRPTPTTCHPAKNIATFCHSETDTSSSSSSCRTKTRGKKEGRRWNDAWNAVRDGVYYKGVRYRRNGAIALVRVPFRWQSYRFRVQGWPNRSMNKPASMATHDVV